MSYPTLQRNGWFPSNIAWAEHVGAHADHGPTGSFDYDDNVAATMQIQVGFGDINIAISDLLGVSRVTRNTVPLTLHRDVPMQHPIFPQMYCTKIQSVTPLKYTGKGLPQGVFTGNSLCSQYDRWIVTAGFTVPKYRVMDDAALISVFGNPPQEWRRFTEWEEVPASQEMSREGSTFFWAEGDAPGSAVVAPMGQRLTTRSLSLIWRRVPRYGLYVETGDDLNSNVLSCVGCVNNATFLGRTAGTLLCTGVRTAGKASPFTFALQTGFVGGSDPNLYYDVTFSMEWFDPPTSGATHGWNDAPYPKQANGYWFRVSTTADGSGPGLVPTADFTKMFQLQNS